ncbi:MAG: hypothetical protein LKI22_08405 [Liquorilactobacillus nagelii]|jgi:hypothetical protein|uniref:hypothetical protein n=1 Tax=Liquorilactobacillus nagelii TaxID=82688 RepID=UPI00242C6E8A|nr:hypothetical protein [Liquorilactobacillus nagelii]MCI1633918.1 hypothetical protein [Liquorilactobacillus nagelii]
MTIVAAIFNFCLIASCLLLAFLFWRGRALFLIAGNFLARKPYDQNSRLAGKYLALLLVLTAGFIAITNFGNLSNTVSWLITIGFTVVVFAIILAINLHIAHLNKK